MEKEPQTNPHLDLQVAPEKIHLDQKKKYKVKEKRDR